MREVVLTEWVDQIVIGAGFGGLATALSLAEAGQNVVLLESLRYPGGCASTFSRGGAQYETGATLFSGLDDDGLFGRWRDAHGMNVAFEFPEQPVTLRTPSVSIPVYRNRTRFVDTLCSFPDAPVAGIRAFFAEQRAVADALWPLFDAPALLPPLSVQSVGHHLRRLPAYLPVLRALHQPVLASLRRCGVADFAPLRTWVDATCQITVQVGASDAEGPFALSALDYLFRGTGHVVGGIGRLASEMVVAIERAGGQVFLAHRARSIVPVAGGYHVESRGRVWGARQVVANLQPGVVQSLLPQPIPRLAALQAPVDQSWGACMLYLRLAPSEDAVAHHLQLIGDSSRPLEDGNHIFVSIGGTHDPAAPDVVRTATVSTHVRMGAALPTAERVAAIQAQMLQTLAERAPEVRAQVTGILPASPRTWARFTGRSLGRVGGVPRRVGWAPYRQAGPVSVAPGLWLVGDSVFLGQSTLATAVGGVCTARAVLAHAGQRGISADEGLADARTDEREAVSAR